MPNQHYYLLTRREGANEMLYNSLFNRKGLSAFGLQPGTLGLVTVVNELGNVFHLNTDTNRSGTNGISGLGTPNSYLKIYLDNPTQNLTRISDTPAAADLIRSHIRDEKGTLVAIVHTNYEIQFGEVAKALGNIPVKASEELF